MARPIGSKNRKEPRNIVKTICLTEDEWQDLENVSSARGMTASKYMRSRFMNAVARDLTKGFDYFVR